MKSLSYIPGVLLSFFLFQNPARAFNFTASTPTQCGDLVLNWQGGTPPFQLLLIPVYDVPRSINIPPSAFTNGIGSFSTQLQFPEGKQFLITISDAQGFGTGGVSDVLTVGAPQGKNCGTNSPNPTFTYQFNSALQQCSPLTVTGYAKGVQPVTFYGVIPLGQTFTMQQPTGASSFNWTSDVAAGTSIVFFMVDAQGRQGGSSNITKVESSNDATCLDSSSPSSTSAHKSPTHATSTSTPVSTGPSHPNSGISSGGIVGIVIGVLLFLAVAITMALFIRRRKQDAQGRFRRQMDLTAGSHPGPSINSTGYTPSASAHTIQNTSQYDANPFASTASVPAYQSPIDRYQANSRQEVHLFPQPPPESHSQLSNPHSPTFMPVGTSVGVPSSQRVESDRLAYDRRREKAIAAGIQPPTRYIVHTDAEDEAPQQDENGVVEVPPRYTMRFAQNAPPDVTNIPTELPYL
ncbi:hypothetical protein F5887DRAFT_943923 [Amanita rubescens]|nr:hypothetical protein F5887DRAFT_943923 [Amanita rubescens]